MSEGCNPTLWVRVPCQIGLCGLAALHCAVVAALARTLLLRGLGALLRVERLVVHLAERRARLPVVAGELELLELELARGDLPVELAEHPAARGAHLGDRASVTEEVLHRGHGGRALPLLVHEPLREEVDAGEVHREVDAVVEVHLHVDQVVEVDHDAVDDVQDLQLGLVGVAREGVDEGGDGQQVAPVERGRALLVAGGVGQCGSFRLDSDRCLLHHLINKLRGNVARIIARNMLKVNTLMLHLCMRISCATI